MKYLIALILAAFLCGCSLTPIQKITLAERSYTAAAIGLKVLVDNGTIKDADTLKAIRTVAVEVDKELDAAKTAAINGDTLGFPFIMGRLNSALDRFLLIYAKAQAAPKEISWTPQASPYFLHPFSRSLAG